MGCWRGGRSPAASPGRRRSPRVLGLGHVRHSLLHCAWSRARRRAPPASRLSILAIGVTGSSHHKVEPVGRLVVGEPRPARGAGGRRARGDAVGHGRNHEGDADLAQDGVGRPHHRHLGHAGQLAEHRLDLGGVHVVAAPDVHLRHPAHQPEVAVGADPAEVAGGDPALGVEHRAGGGGVDAASPTPGRPRSRAGPPPTAAGPAPPSPGGTAARRRRRPPRARPRARAGPRWWPPTSSSSSGRVPVPSEDSVEV